MIILDPPAFAKNKRDVAKATRGYKEINLHAIKHLTTGGVLATFSCSNFIEEDLFHKIVQIRSSGWLSRPDVRCYMFELQTFHIWYFLFSHRLLEKAEKIFHLN